MRRALALLLLAALPAAVIGAEARSRALESTTWKLRVVPDKQAAAQGATPFQEKIVFQDGKMLATESVKYGFEAVPYEARTDKSGVAWAAQLRSFEGSAQWQGVAAGETLTGTLSWTKPDGRTHQYTFVGQRRRGELR